MSRFPFTPYPNGWFVVAFSEELSPGQVLNLHYFGRDIVLYRTESGEAHAIDPYCPHLGTHLGHGGRVIGETLRCPFHGWCFDDTGRCVSVPNLARPPRASVSRWHLRESDGLLYLYHHAQGAAPDWDVAIVDTDGWSPDLKAQWRVRTHPQEVIENGFDIAHFNALHGMGDMEIMRPPSDEGSLMRMRLGYDSSPDERLEVEVAIYGLGLVNTVAEVMQTGFRDRQRLYMTPVDDEMIDLRAIVNIQNTSDPDETAQTAQGFFEAFEAVVTADFPIWENKRYVERPLLTRADGPIHLFRTWARRFYDS